VNEQPDTTILICRNPDCGSDWGVQEAENGECLNCGLGVADPADRPAGKLVPATELPHVLGGGIQRCALCERAWSAATYHLERKFGDAGRGAICRYCAHLDVDLTVWQDLCDVADAIDAVMQRCDDARQRHLFGALIAGFASHFSDWRWPDEPPASTSPRS
jgi:hypothetical protein